MSGCVHPSKVYPELGLPKWQPFDINANRDYSDDVAAIAARYESAPYWHVPKSVKALVQSRTLELFAAIPIPVIAIPGCEPFATVDDAKRFIDRNGFFPVRLRGIHGALGKFMTEFRTVHDWYGHLLANHPFTIRGEMAAYEVHTAQFPQCTHPVIWENVVLENAYYVNRGKWLQYPQGCQGCRAKIALDVVKFPDYQPC